MELLTEPEDACYLAAQTHDIQLKIKEMLCLLKNKLPFKDVDWLIEICDNVFSGEKFDDIMFNNVIEHFIQKKIEQKIRCSLIVLADSVYLIEEKEC